MAVKSRYVYGSAAPQLPQEPGQQLEKEVGVKKAQVVTVRPSGSRLPKLQLMLGLLIAFVLCFTVVYRYARISEMTLQARTMERNWNQLRESNRQLQIQISSSIELDKVRKMAKERLGMHEPAMNQVVTVQVPKTSYSVVLDEDYIQLASDADTSPLARVLASFGGMVR